MKEEKVISLLSKEIEAITPSNFDAIKKGIANIDKTKVNEEPISFVEEKKNNRNWIKWAVGGLLTTTAASLAIILPINNSIDYNNSISNVKVTLADSNQSAVINYKVDRNGKIIDSIVPMNQHAKKILAGLKNKSVNTAITPSQSVKDILNFSSTTLDKESNKLFNDEELTLTINISGGNISNESFISGLTDSFNEIKDIYSNTTINVSSAISLGDKASDKLKSEKDKLMDMYDLLIGNDIECSFNFNEYIKDHSEAQINDAYNAMVDFYNIIPLDEDLELFKQDFVTYYSIYENRKDILNDFLDLCDQSLDKCILETNSSNVTLLQALKETGYFFFGNVSSFDFDVFNYFYDGLPINDEGLFQIAFDIAPKLVFEHSYSFESNKLNYVIETYNQIIDMIDKNEKWFMMIFNVLPQKELIKDNDGFDITSSDYSYSWSNKDYFDLEKTYWDNYWNN